MAGELSSTSLAGYGANTYERDHFTCIYCGFDGRTFDAWLQLSIDHIRPKNCGGNDDPENLAVACGSCNCITSRMKFDATMSRDDILKEKRTRVAMRRQAFYDFWIKSVAPHYLKRPLPDIKTIPSKNETPEQVAGNLPHVGEEPS